MTPQQWEDQARLRLAISEGYRVFAYRDSLGVLTIGIGFNLERSDARYALAQAGVTDVDGVMSGKVPMTKDQVWKLFDYSFAPIVSEARASLADGIFDALTDARRFVICDLVFNLGADGWGAFMTTRQLIDQAQAAKNAGKDGPAHELFELAAEHLEESAWYGQVGNRAKRDVAMMRSGVWVDPYRDGT